ncbi:MAG: fibro-slime domain-containing protein [Planctomycetes bacterium]|nr:fibro-slime domain-containing protein [Planctomycetota bacterium]
MRYGGTDKDEKNGNVIRTAVTWSGMAVLGVVAYVVSQPRASGMWPPPPPDVVSLTGTIRDFKKNHVDFNVVPNGGSGHYAMNVALDLGADDRPTFRGTGFRVATQWRDGVSNPIAPHLYGGGVGLVKLASAPTIGGGTTVDTWDSSVGPYDPATAGPEPSFYTGAEMPTIEVPADLAARPNVDIRTYTGNNTFTLNSDLHCDELLINDDATLQIEGNIMILCETLFEMKDDASISFMPGSSLVLYTLGGVSIQDSTINSGSYDPTVFTIYHLGNTDILIADGAEVIATIVAPNAGLRIKDKSNFYGTYEGQTLNVANSGGFHLDESMPLDACDFLLNDSKGTAGIASTGGIDSADSFGQWYRDVLGMNLSAPHTIELVRDGGGIYEFISDEFYPIDGQLHGNQGDPHNNYFTFRFTAYFTYEACNEPPQFFEFEGSDDAWLFIDRSMAIDLGGIIPGTDQHVDLDRLGLVDGQVYAMQFFYAHRNPTQAMFRVRTNVPLIGTEAESVNASFD